jgi:hypothetical protein
MATDRAGLSLRTILYGTIGLLGLLLVGVIGRDCVQAWTRAGDAGIAVQVADATRTAFKALQLARLERGPIRDGLAATAPLPAPEQTRLLHIHDGLDQALDALAAACATLACDAGPHGADVAAGRQATEAARRIAADELARAPADRTSRTCPPPSRRP